MNTTTKLQRLKIKYSGLAFEDLKNTWEIKTGFTLSRTRSWAIALFAGSILAFLTIFQLWLKQDLYERWVAGRHFPPATLVYGSIAALAVLLIYLGIRQAFALGDFEADLNSLKDICSTSIPGIMLIHPAGKNYIELCSLLKDRLCFLQLQVDTGSDHLEETYNKAKRVCEKFCLKTQADTQSVTSLPTRMQTS